jgi:arsenical pump membrane protein
VALAGLLLALGAISPSAAGTAVRPLITPLAFLLFAVPLAVMLDRVGFFASVAALADTGRNPLLGLWILAAAVTTFLNLDASVVLLTPLYIRIARRHGLDPAMLAFQPVILASLASSALPISNLTNLIAANRYHLGVADFLVRLGPASLVAVAVGWFFYRGVGAVRGGRERIRDAVDRRSLWIGTPIVVFVVLGFTLGDVLGIPAWAVAAVADVPLLVLTRLRGSTLAVSEIPFGAAALAVGLGVIASAAAPHLGLEAIFRGSGPVAQLQVAGAAMLGAVTINNLPALLIGLPLAGGNSELLWPLLFGVNFGPALILHGSLAGLLWHSTAARLDVHVSPLEYTRLGLRVGLPALLAGLGALLVTNALAG